MALPNPAPNSGSLLAPKMRKAMTRTTRISVNEILGIVEEIFDRSADKCKENLIILATFVILSLIFASPAQDHDYRQEMRKFVIALSRHAKTKNPNFLIIPQNGSDVVTATGEALSTVDMNYLNAIDGIGREDLSFGYTGDNVPTPQKDREEILSFLRIYQNHGKTVLVTDYTNVPQDMDKAFAKNHKLGFVGLAAPRRLLDIIPSYPKTPYGENNGDVLNLKDIKNFLFILNPQTYQSKEAFLADLKKTNYDLILIDLFFQEKPFTADEVIALKKKANGGQRLIICYLSIGEAEDYRHYWQKEWKTQRPTWLTEENPHWKGNYKVRYWEAEWKKIILNYLDQIVAARFDGVYLDIIDAYWHFINKENESTGT